MDVNWWTAPELRVAITAAQAGVSRFMISKRLRKLGYNRTPTAVDHRLRRSGVVIAMRWTEPECEALRVAYVNRTDRQAACPARSMSAIRTKAKMLGLTYPEPR